MSRAYPAVAWLSASIVPDSHEPPISLVEAAKDTVKKVRLPVFAIPSNGICASIRDLNHACEATVHEQRVLDDPSNVAPPRCSALVKELHQTYKALGNGFVSVLNQKPIA
ncbi:MAG: hypothetical protein AAB368_02215, partial [bacterium]